MTSDRTAGERLGGTVHGDSVLYHRGEETYEVLFGWDDRNHKLYKLCWPSVFYRRGPRQDRRLSEQEKRLVIERTAALLREGGAEVIIEEPEDLEAAIPDSSHVFANANYSFRKPWWKFW